MRYAVLLTMLWAVPFAASAQDCRTVPRATDRLACYDRAAPPMGLDRSALGPVKPDGGSRDAARSRMDILEAENTKLNSRIKSICRGC
jgi:hypothetical protein